VRPRAAGGLRLFDPATAAASEAAWRKVESREEGRYDCASLEFERSSFVFEFLYFKTCLTRLLFCMNQVCTLAADDPEAWARSLRVLFASYDADGRGGSIGVTTHSHACDERLFPCFFVFFFVFVFFAVFSFRARV
jgi:hypothetical protein